MSLLSGTHKVLAETLRKGQFIVGKGHILEVNVHIDDVANTYGAKNPKKERRLDHAGYQSAIAYEGKVQYKPGQTGRVTIKGTGWSHCVAIGTEVEIFVQPTTPILASAAQIERDIDAYRKAA
jgi:hypothetical protein